MDQNGCSSPDPMILDVPSPTTPSSLPKPPKDMPDEPTAPRRNSNDDSDTTLPRKRPAVMAPSDELDKHSPATTRSSIEKTPPPLEADTIGDDVSVDSDRTIGTPAAITASPSKTMPLRHGKQDFSVPIPPSKLHKGSRADSPISLHSSQDERSPRSVSPDAASPVVEAVESVDDADAIADQIRLLGPNAAQVRAQSAALESLKSVTESLYEGLLADEKTVQATLEELKRRFGTEPAPYKELRATTDALARINKEMEADLEQWVENLSHERVLPDNLQVPILALLKRNTSFSDDFVNNELGIDGELEINSICAQYIHNMNVMIQLDTARLRASPLEDVRLYSRRYILITQKFCQKADLHDIVGVNFWSSLFGVYNALAGPDSFADLMDPFLNALYEKVPKQPKLFPVITDVLILADLLFQLSRHIDRDDISTKLVADLPRKLSPGFLTVESRLPELLKSHISVLEVNSFGAQVDALKTLGVHLYTRPTGMLLGHLRDRTQLYSVDPIQTQHRTLLVEQMIQFPIFYQMLSASRMDFRLRGLTRMTATLLDLWRNHGNTFIQYGSCVLKYVTGFLLENKVVQYLVGPESHFELIRRCHNVPSFLFVSRTMTLEIMDAMWQPVLSNKDPRVVSATLIMSQEMTVNMDTEPLVALCLRICKIPYESVDYQVMELISRVVDKLRKNCSPGDLTSPAPYNMLIQLIRHASEKDESSGTDGPIPPTQLFEIANTQLRLLADIGPGSLERKNIYDGCVKDFRDKNASVTGSATVILCFLSRRMGLPRPGSPNMNDVAYLITALGFPALMVEELESFVKSHRGTDSEGRMRKLRSRLDLLSHFLQQSPACLTVEHHAKLWKCLVGDDAYGPAERNLGFEFYLRFADSPMLYRTMLDCIFRDLFPQLDPQCFSSGVLEFCKRSMGYLTQHAQRMGDQDDSNTVRIDGIEQLWRIILTTDDQSLADEAIINFVGTYLDNYMITSAGVDAIKTTHLQIVERCIDQLLDASTKWRSGKTDDDIMYKNTLARTFVRSIELLHSLVLGLRSRPAYFSVRHRAQPEPLQIRGEPFVLRFRVNADSSIQTLEVGTLNTGAELYDQLRALAGQIRKAVARGRDLKLEENPAKPIAELGCTKDDLIQIYAASSQQLMNDGPGIYSCDAIEDEIMKHYAEFHTLLDLPSPLAGKAWNFLSIFPADEEVKKQVVDPEVPWTVLYPSEKPFRTHYSTHALWAALHTASTSQDSLSSFIRTSLPKLTAAFVQTDGLQSGDLAGLGMRITMLNVMKDILNQPVPVETYKDVFEDPARIVNCLLGLIEQFLSPAGEAEIVAAECVASAVYVLFECSKVDAKVWSSFRDRVDADWVYQLLVKDEREQVRCGLRQAILLLCSDSDSSESDTQRTFARGKTEYASVFWPILCGLISSDDPRRPILPANGRELFQTAYHTFQFVVRDGSGAETGFLDLPKLFANWMKRLYEHPFVEIVGRPVEDYAIQGYTHLLRSCVLAMKDRKLQFDVTDGIDRVWTKLLFPKMEPSDLETPLPILHDATRTELYRLFLDLIDGPETLMELVHVNNDLFGAEYEQLLDSSIAERDRWLVSTAGKGGLQNLSNTCYLNSLLTQLFMNERFREFVLSLDVPNTEDTKVMYNLHVLFARMQNGYQKAVEPREVVESLRDFAGDPIDPTIQMDVDEFFNLLFDRLENEMRDEKLKAKFKSVYGGHLVQQVKSKECSHISEREEAFSAIQCDIKGKSTLLESLKAYVEGETMEGDNKYRCSTCDKLVDAVKRTCLKDVPDNLIFHLKRFDFDLQTMNRSKINDYFEFPNTIDMAPFKLEYLTAVEENEDTTVPPDEFELVGVLVHTGTAESGHYYSYIKDRLVQADTPAWLEFNDSEVSAFDPESIAAACYGGCDNPMPNGYQLNKAFSAYMLFYQRKTAAQSTNNPGITGRRTMKDTGLMNSIARDNYQMIKRYCMFGDNYMSFLRELFEAAYSMSKESDEIFTKRDVQDVMRLALQAFQQICSKFKDCQEWSNFQNAILRAVNADETCCRCFLDWASNALTIRSMLLENLYPNVRQQFTRMLLTALRQLKETNPVAYGMVPDESPTKRSRSYLFKVLWGFSVTWNNLQWAIRPWQDFFYALLQLAEQGQIEVDYMLKAEILYRVLQTFQAAYMGQREQSQLDLINFPKLLSKPRVGAARPVEILEILMGRVSPFLEQCPSEEHRDAMRQLEYLPMTQREKSFFTYTKDHCLTFFNSCLEHPNAMMATAGVITKIITSGVSPERDPLLVRIKDTLLSAISVDPAHQAAPYLRCLQAFVEATTCDLYIRDIIHKVASEVGTIGVHGGEEHFEFFHGLVESASAKQPDSPIMSYVIINVPLWAPALILYCEEDVREKTADLLDAIMFDESKADESLEKEISQAAQELWEASMTFVKEKMAVTNSTVGTVEDRTFVSLNSVLSRCRQFLDWEDEEVQSRMRDFQQLVEQLVRDEEEDIALNSADEWANSDMDSDAAIDIAEDGFRP